ncbi:MAG TPA: hypothetical protein VKZ49_15375, partial [Polyangiaceae bacterium]|nr:hypothetical protein [Polyangiaceae bacterium]
MAQRPSKSPPSAAEPEQRLVETSRAEDDERFDRIFRPQALDDFVGQERHKQNLRVYVRAALARKEPLDH